MSVSTTLKYKNQSRHTASIAGTLLATLLFWSATAHSLVDISVEGPAPHELSVGRTLTGFITIYNGGNRSPAHGEWQRQDKDSITGAVTLLQAAPSGTFIGGFKNVYGATLTGENEMTGTIDSYLYMYTTAGGSVIVDADGFPVPSPLAPVSQCATTAGCTKLGLFSFKVRRIASQ